MEYCASDDWRKMVHETILPEALRGVELGDEAIEIGPGPGFTTDVLRNATAHLTAVEVDGGLAASLAERLAGGNVDVVVGDATALDYPPRALHGRRLLPHAPPHRAGRGAGPGVRRAGAGPRARRRAGGGGRDVQRGQRRLPRGRHLQPDRARGAGAAARRRRLRRRGGAHLRPGLGLHRPGGHGVEPHPHGPGAAGPATRDQWHYPLTGCAGTIAPVPVLFGLLAAFSNGLNVVMQHVASIGDPLHSKGWRFVRYLVSNPLWLLGWAALAAAFIFQAIALHNGPISVVQPLLVTELVFVLVLRWLWFHQSIRRVTWWAAGITCIFADGLPRDGRAQRRQRPAHQRSLGVCQLRHGRDGGAAGPPRPGRLAGEAGRPPGGFGLRSLGARGHVYQGDHRHADPVRPVWHVHPLAAVRARRDSSVGRIPDAGRVPRRTAQHVPAVHRHRRPHREHRARVSGSSGSRSRPMSARWPSGRSPSSSCAAPSRSWLGVLRPPWTRTRLPPSRRRNGSASATSPRQGRSRASWSAWTPRRRRSWRRRRTAPPGSTGRGRLPPSRRRCPCGPSSPRPPARR